MAAFDYVALDAAGRRKRGVLNAESPRHVRSELRRMKLTPIEVAPSSASGGSGKLFAFDPGRVFARPAAVRGKDLSVVTRQLATLTSAAAPVEEAIQTVAAQSEKDEVRKVLADVRARVTEGARLSHALSAHPKSFSPLYVAMVRAGETAGRLGPVLERLADQLERARKMSGKIRSALVYPAVLSVVALAVVILLMTFIVPRVAEQFDGLGRELPLLTRLMIGLSDALVNYGWVMALIAALLGLVAGRLLQAPFWRARADALALKLPVIGPLMRDLHSARLARTLSALTASEAPIMEGLDAARATVRNVALQKALTRAVHAIRDGATLSQALKRTEAFAPIVIYMAAMGEKTATLAAMLEKASDYLENELDETTQTALSLMEPLIIVVLGAVVATIVLSVMLPLLQLNTLAVS